MGRIGFWQLLLDDKVSWWEARSINAAHDAADIALGQAQATAYTQQQLSQRLDQMSREIVMLRTAVTVLVKTLRDTNVVDPQLLDARLEAALEEAMAPPEPPKQAQAQPMELKPLTCLRCREQKPAAATTMTADGPVCDVCINKPA